MYDKPLVTVIPKDTGTIGVETLTAATAVHGEWMVFHPAVIRRIEFVVTTTVAANTAAPVVTFRKRVTPGSSSGQSTIGTLTIPTGTVAGAVVYKDVTPVALAVGDSICLDHTTQATDSGSAAGAGYYGFELFDDPKSAVENSDMLASA